MSNVLKVSHQEAIRGLHKKGWSKRRIPAGNANKVASRRAIDDGAASLLAHLAQLVLHAVPHAPEIDCVHAIEFFGAGSELFHPLNYFAVERLLNGDVRHRGCWSRAMPNASRPE